MASALFKRTNATTMTPLDDILGPSRDSKALQEHAARCIEESDAEEKRQSADRKELARIPRTACPFPGAAFVTADGQLDWWRRGTAGTHSGVVWGIPVNNDGTLACRRDRFSVIQFPLIELSVRLRKSPYGPIERFRQRLVWFGLINQYRRWHQLPLMLWHRAKP